MGDILPFGPSRKLPDLLLKAYVRWTGLTDDQRNRLIPFLHVSLDSLSLSNIMKRRMDGWSVDFLVQIITGQRTYCALALVCCHT